MELEKVQSPSVKSGATALERMILLVMFAVMAALCFSVLFSPSALPMEQRQEAVLIVAVALLVAVGSIALRSTLKPQQKRVRGRG